MSTQPRSRKNNSPLTQNGRQTDVSSPPLKSQQNHHHSDDTIVKEFGGPIGVTMMMIFFPLLMNYLWLCVHVKSGSLLSLLSVKDILFRADCRTRYSNLVCSKIVLGILPSSRFLGLCDARTYCERPAHSL